MDRYDDLGLWPAEPGGIEVLDELWQRRLPRLLPMVSKLAELPRIQPKLPCHLHMRMREPVPPTRVDPHLQAGREWLRLRGHRATITDHGSDLVAA